ncbi:MAG: hypothetical protein IT236_05900, partial [Bacteroidia bacterium]|nr:hypothetical protein [Bacteroidia bacterium]
AFLIQEADTVSHDKFHQLLGKTIVGTIVRDTIRKAVVTGNAEIIYYPKNKNKFMGLNKTSAPEILMWLKSGDVERVTMKGKTQGQIDPLKDLEPNSSTLKGFNWAYDKRPKSRFDLHPAKEKVEAAKNFKK